MRWRTEIAVRKYASFSHFLASSQMNYTWLLRGALSSALPARCPCTFAHP
jgi:hypothetical protein